MRIVIRKPTRFIEIFRDAKKLDVHNDDVEKLYNVLPGIIEKLGIDFTILETNEQVHNYRRRPDDILLSWHDYGMTKNTWYIKSGYLPNYFYFDSRGFSGWSELTTSYHHDIDVNEVREWVESVCSNHIENNITRFTAPYDDPLPSNPYVLVIDQRPDDIVNDLAYINYLPHHVKQTFADTKYDVIVKSSPLAIEYSKTGWRFEIEEDAGSLHALISSASAIYTINSSAGFEALLHGKRVFTTGLCDYHWATTTLKTREDLRRSIELIDEPIDNDARIKFLHYCLTEYFMTTHDVSSIEKKILRAVDEYQRNDVKPQTL